MIRFQKFLTMVCFAGSVGLMFAGIGSVVQGNDGPIRKVIRKVAGNNVTVVASDPVQSDSSIPKTALGRVNHGKLFYDFVRVRLATELRRHHGMNAVDARATAESVTDEMISSASQHVKIPVGAFGDGSIIQAIIDFFQSPTGQALLKALIDYLIMILGMG